MCVAIESTGGSSRPRCGTINQIILASALSFIMEGDETISGTLQVGKPYHFDVDEKRKWFKKHWHWTLVASVLYMLFIHYGQLFMLKRKPLHLKPYLIMWNTGLALFSVMGAVNVVPEFLGILLGKGFIASVCEPGGQFTGSIGYWSFLIHLSKLPELIDTVFLVLRKRKVIFLHAYHHVTVLVIGWYVYQEETTSLRWAVAMNFVIHSLMYSYYAFRAAGFHVPKPVAMTITVLQILQMFMGSFLASMLLVWSFFGSFEKCYHQPLAVKISFGMWCSYLILFVVFFRNAYFAPQKSTEMVQKQD